jgi:predicted secreted hydrolase
MEGLQKISADADKGRMMKSSFEFKIINTALLFILLLPFVFPVLPFTAHASDWKQATDGRVWSFPEDHGSHPEFMTEWWYFTGNLSDKAENRYGYQLTFFRQGIKKSAAGGAGLSQDSPWAVNDVYLAHFALTDVGKKLFRHTDRTSRTGPGLAGASTKGMDVHVLDWSANMEMGVIYLNARYQGIQINLALKPGKPVVLHGRNGLSMKGPAKGQSSYYYSFTNLKTSGSIKISSSQASVDVDGVSWFDHEFGSNQLTPEQIGWDWFGIHLSDGRDLMIYFIRRKDGSIEAASSGTLIEKNGVSIHLKLEDIQIDVLEKWKSPRSDGTYPCRWRLRIPSARIDLIIAASVADQELTTGASTDITYWEGAVEGKGTSGDNSITVEGYVELTGYAGSIGGVF